LILAALFAAAFTFKANILARWLHHDELRMHGDPTMLNPSTSLGPAVEFEKEGSRWDLMDCLNQNQESYRV
jgi:hypothetical protein